jgi:hypothetical protein
MRMAASVSHPGCFRISLTTSSPSSASLFAILFTVSPTSRDSTTNPRSKELNGASADGHFALSATRSGHRNEIPAKCWDLGAA